MSALRLNPGLFWPPPRRSLLQRVVEWMMAACRR